MRDRLSDLPDETRLQILASLPSTKLQASTSALSRQWRHLWTAVPSLSFRLDDFSPLPTAHPVHTISYPRIVDHCLSLSTAPSIDRLSLDVPQSPGPAVDRWLSFASSRSVRHLSLCFFSYDFSPPPSLFYCISLTSLTLEGCSLYPLPEGGGFPCLKSISLIRVEASWDTLQPLIYACPLLETLVIQECGGFATLVISAARNPCLVNLAFIDWNCNVLVRLETPHLRSLLYRGRPHLLLVESFLTQLQRVGILEHCGHAEGAECWYIASAISCATLLVVDSWFSKVLVDRRNHNRQPPMYVGLKKLHCPLRTVHSAYDMILEVCPSLEMLCVECEYTSEDEWLPVDAAPVYKVSKRKPHPLKVMRLLNIVDMPRSLEDQLSFILDNAVSLETLTVHPSPGATAKQCTKLKKSVSRLRISSPSANVVVSKRSSSSGDNNPCYMKLWESEVEF